MTLTKIDRMEIVEEIIQEKIRNTELELESLGEMKDAEICRLRIMYLLDLNELRKNLITIRHKLDMEYAMTSARKEYHDQITSFTEGCHVGGRDEEDCRGCGVSEPAAEARHGGGIPDVGRDGGNLPGDGQGGKPENRGNPGRRLKRWQIDAMRQGRTRATSGR